MWPAIPKAETPSSLDKLILLVGFLGRLFVNDADAEAGVTGVTGVLTAIKASMWQLACSLVSFLTAKTNETSDMQNGFRKSFDINVPSSTHRVAPSPSMLHPPAPLRYKRPQPQPSAA